MGIIHNFLDVSETRSAAEKRIISEGVRKAAAESWKHALGHLIELLVDSLLPLHHLAKNISSESSNIVLSRVGLHRSVSISHRFIQLFQITPQNPKTPT